MKERKSAVRRIVYNFNAGGCGVNNRRELENPKKERSIVHDRNAGGCGANNKKESGAAWKNEAGLILEYGKYGGKRE